MDWSKKGSSRIVYLIGNYAIKLPRAYSFETFLWGLLANIQEIRLSKTKNSKLLPVLCNIGCLIVVMPRVEPLENKPFESDEAFATWIDESDMCIPVENKPDSFAIYEDRLVAIDYG